MAYEGFAPIKSWSICIESQILSHKLGKDNYDWLGHVERMPEERTVKKALKNIPDGIKSVAKPRKRWLDDVE